uniref:class I SAM-dependent methyltransferase n=1 Tax=Nonomuraea pusilla TaxID=46177 RepID=UPI0006E2EB74|nr:class I SAM-dependent methyltransferase [Nonomuraea pusilla]
MPTIPSEGSRPPARAPHQARDMAESFGTDPERYDRARPRYPDAMVNRVVAASPGHDVLDVGIGTGIAARQFEAAGCVVLGVEVDPRMAGWARRRGHEVEVAAFESWDPAGRTFDAVVSAQTWHWIDPVAGAARAAEALRPGGLLAAFWNVEQPPPDVARAFSAVYERLLPDSLTARQWAATGHGYTALLDRAADGIRAYGAYGEPEQWRFGWERTYTRDEWLDLVPTSGTHTRLPPGTLEEVLAGLGAALDALGGGFTMRYSTVVVAATRHRAT